MPAAEGRGRLSSIDLLPDEAEPDVVWANEALRERAMPANAILAEFNARLADRGIAGISKSAWGRYAVRKAIQFRKLDEMRRLSSEVVADLGAHGADEVTVMVGELIKLRLFELLEDRGPGAKGLMEAARALQSAVGSQKASTEHRRQLEALRAQVGQAVDRAASIAQEAGISAERIAQLRREFLGVGG